jgi:dihydropyrimidinase
MAKRFDTLIKDGLVVTGTGIRKADVGIQGEQIAVVDADLPAQEANRVVDADGKYVMPGVIDVHCHPVYEDDFGGLSLTAAYGGTTTVIHYAYARPGMKLFDMVKKFQEV